jgi:benzoyl-CoA 2,3-dioxygenase component B
MAAGSDPRASGAVDLETVQKYLNRWFSLSLDLFGGEVSSNAADYFAAGLKGRYKEADYDDHRGLDASYRLPVIESGRLVEREVPLRNALNEVLRDAYIRDCQRGVDRWNKTLARAGVSGLTLTLPGRRFNRRVGAYTGHHFDPGGNVIDEAAWTAGLPSWLPTTEDEMHVRSLMKPVYEPGRIASWIAPPARGINGQPLDFEYVRFN